MWKVYENCNLPVFSTPDELPAGVMSYSFYSFARIFTLFCVVWPLQQPSEVPVGHQAAPLGPFRVAYLPI